MEATSIAIQLYEQKIKKHTCQFVTLPWDVTMCVGNCRAHPNEYGHRRKYSLDYGDGLCSHKKNAIQTSVYIPLQLDQNKYTNNTLCSSEKTSHEKIVWIFPQFNWTQRNFTQQPWLILEIVKLCKLTNKEQMH